MFSILIIIAIIAIIVILIIVTPNKNQNYIEKLDDKAQEEALKEYVAKKKSKKDKKL